MAEVEDICWIDMTRNNTQHVIKIGQKCSLIHNSDTLVKSIVSTGPACSIFDPRGAVFVHMDDGFCIGINPSNISSVGYVKDQGV